MRNKADITSLPKELITHILSYLTDKRDLINAHQSNTLFAEILDLDPKMVAIFKKIYCKIFQRHYTEIQYAPLFLGIQEPSPNWIALYNALPDELKTEIVEAENLKEKNKIAPKSFEEKIIKSCSLPDFDPDKEGCYFPGWRNKAHFNSLKAPTLQSKRARALTHFLLSEYAELNEDIWLILRLEKLWDRDALIFELGHLRKNLRAIPIENIASPKTCTLSEYAQTHGS